MTLSELEWLSKIFSDKKRRAVSLRQLSLLLVSLCIRRLRWGNPRWNIPMEKNYYGVATRRLKTFYDVHRRTESDAVTLDGRTD